MLPFVQPPAPVSKRRVGNASTGILEIDVRNGLTVDESNTIADLLNAEQSSLVAGAKLAEAIAAEEKISISEAFQIIESTIMGRTLEPAANEISLRHATKIQEVHRIYNASSRRTTEATVTAILRHRCKLPTWTLDDTRGLDRALFDDLWKLALDEQEAESMPSTPPSEADLKKPQPETPAKQKPTGTKSSGT